MSKRLPYFQFEPAEWLAGDIMFCTLQAQGLFTTLKALYWQKDCDLSLDQAVKRLKNDDFFNELITEKIIKIKAGKIRISFLDEQWSRANNKTSINSENGKKGAEARWRKNGQAIATPSESPSVRHSESMALREENSNSNNKKREDNNNTILGIDARKLKFSSTLEPFLEKYGRSFLNDFYKYWTEPNKSQTKFRQELEKTWDLERRLETWAKNDNNFKANHNGKSNSAAGTGFAKNR